jgi:histidinol-phosphate aminotransferase
LRNSIPNKSVVQDDVLRKDTMNEIVLDRNENQYGPAPECYEALRKANLEQLSLYSREFARGRKSELSDTLAKRIGIPEERLLLSYGSEEMLKQVVHCYLHKDEILLLPRQSWWYYKKVASEVFGKEVEYSLVERNGRFEYDVKQICDLYDKHSPQLVLIASPNNPTGSTISQEDLATVVDHCASAVIVLDEAYYGFTSESNDHLKELLDTHQRLVIMRTFSKYYALAGLRIGYACVGEDLKQLVAFSARYLGFNQLSEKIALAALNAPEYYRAITQKIHNDKEKFYRSFVQLPGFTPFPSDANFILVRYPVPMKQTLDEGLKQRGIIVKFLSDPGLEDCMRITIGTEEQDVRVLAAFNEIMGKETKASHAHVQAAVSKR